MANITMLPGDWALGAAALSLSVMGLFRGFSGSLAFVAAGAGATATAMFLWGWLTRWAMQMWVRGAIALAVSLLVFGCIRAVVKKVVNGLLAQPADAIFGFAVGLLVSALAVLVLAAAGVGFEYSNIVREVARHVG